MIDDEGELLWFEGNQATNRLPRILGLAMGNLWDLHNHFFWPFDDSKNVQPLVRSPLRALHPPAVPRAAHPLYRLPPQSRASTPPPNSPTLHFSLCGYRSPPPCASSLARHVPRLTRTRACTAAHERVRGDQATRRAAAGQTDRHR